jgi:hypothetical protein
MSTFGPFYPGRLQELVDHAERIARVLKVEERREGCDDLRDAWLTGRASELEQFVEAVAGEWRGRMRALDSVTAALSSYLEELHDGMLTHLGSRGLDCCLAGLDTTTVPLRAVADGAYECPSAAGGRPSGDPAPRLRAMAQRATSVAT